MRTWPHLLSCFQVARNLGKTLRAFQPTIREIQVGPWFVVAICLRILLRNVIWFAALRMYQGNSGALLNEKSELMRFPNRRIISPQPWTTTNNLLPTQVSWFDHFWISFQCYHAHFSKKELFLKSTFENHVFHSNTTMPIDVSWFDHLNFFQCYHAHF